MHVNHQMTVSSSLDNPLIEIDHPLVTMVHEINLNSSHSHISESFEQVEMVFHALPGKPKKNADALALSVVNDFLQIEVVVGHKRVSRLLCPTLIHQNIFYTILSSKVDIIFIGVSITSSMELYIRSVRDITTPPFPHYLAGVHP